MKMSYLYVCLDAQNSGKTKLKLDFNDTNIGSITVEELKEKLKATQPNLPKNYDLTFFGKILKSNNKLSSYGIKTGANLFLISNLYEKQDHDNESNSQSKIQPSELNKAMLAIRTALMNPNFRSMLNRLYDKEFRDNIVNCIPGLRENIIAFSILQDPELMMICTDAENLTKIAEKYPVFAEASLHLATAFHEENSRVTNSTQSNGSNLSSVFGENAYSMNYESDDDLVDNAPPEGQQVRETRPILQNRITLFQFQQALQAATRPSTSTQQATDLSSSSSFNSLLNQRPTTNQSTSQVPSNEIASNRSAAATTNQPASSQETTERKNWTEQLSKMREMGLINERIAILALEASGGNVDEAVNWYLILSDQGND